MSDMIHEWKITETAEGYLLEERDNRGSVWPPTQKGSRREVAARLMQVMGIGPVAPQIGPEVVYVGSINGQSVGTDAEDTTSPEQNER